MIYALCTAHHVLEYTISHSREDAWAAAFEVLTNVHPEWREKYWKRSAAFRRRAKRHGYTVERVLVTRRT
jgi:hypothetical protein